MGACCLSNDADRFFALFISCSAGPFGNPPVGCDDADLDNNGRVDLLDYKLVQNGGHVGIGCAVTTEAICTEIIGTNSGDNAVGLNAPAITTQPANAVACQNGSAAFTVVAKGTGTLTYQWQKNGANVGGNSPTLTLMNLPVTDNGA